MKTLSKNSIISLVKKADKRKTYRVYSIVKENGDGTITVAMDTVRLNIKYGHIKSVIRKGLSPAATGPKTVWWEHVYPKSISICKHKSKDDMYLQLFTASIPERDSISGKFIPGTDHHAIKRPTKFITVPKDSKLKNIDFGQAISNEKPKDVLFRNILQIIGIK